MLKNFNYSFPTEIVFGKDSIDNLSSLLDKYKVKKILFVYGMNSIFENGIYKSVLNQLKSRNIHIVEYGGCNQNPNNIFVDDGAKLALSENVDFVLAAGGGSVIDAAKAISLLLKNESDSGIWKYMISEIKFINDAIPLGVILTSFGTGSESNGSFVISNNLTGEKLGKSHLSSRPVFAICDPTYTLTLTSKQTSFGCVDIVSHLLEQYFCKEENNVLNDLISTTLKNVINNSLIISKNQSDIRAKSELMMMSTFSLSYFLSLGKTLDWSVHKIEHALSGIYNVPHAAGLACIFPAWMYYASQNKIIMDKLFLLGKDLDIIKDGFTVEKSRETVIKYFYNFFKKMEMEVSLKRLLGFNPDIDKISKTVLKYGEIGLIFKIDYKNCCSILKYSK